MNTPRLETERLVLRRFEPSDLQAFFQIFSDGEVNRFLPWFPVRDLEEAQAFYQQRYAPVYAKAQGYAYAICRKEDNVPIGYVNGETEGARDFGYGLRKEFWGQGIVTEASRAVLAQMKEDGVPFVTATHDRENPGSGKVMQKLGMVYHYSYREQWQPKDISVVFRMYQLNLAMALSFLLCLGVSPLARKLGWKAGAANPAFYAKQEEIGRASCRERV